MSVKKQCLRLKDLFVNRICFLAEPGKPVIKIQIARRYRWLRRATIRVDDWPAFTAPDPFTEHRVLVIVVGCEVDVDLHRVLSLCNDDVTGGETVTRVFSKYKAAKRWSEVRAGVMPVERSFFIRNQLCRDAATEV